MHNVSDFKGSDEIIAQNGSYREIGSKIQPRINGGPTRAATAKLYFQSLPNSESPIKVEKKLYGSYRHSHASKDERNKLHQERTSNGYFTKGLNDINTLQHEIKRSEDKGGAHARAVATTLHSDAQNTDSSKLIMEKMLLNNKRTLNAFEQYAEIIKGSKSGAVSLPFFKSIILSNNRRRPGDVNKIVKPLAQHSELTQQPEMFRYGTGFGRENFKRVSDILIKSSAEQSESERALTLSNIASNIGYAKDEDIKDVGDLIISRAVTMVDPKLRDEVLLRLSSTAKAIAIASRSSSRGAAFKYLIKQSKKNASIIPSKGPIGWIKERIAKWQRK